MSDFSMVVVLDHRRLVAEILASGLTTRGYPAVGLQLDCDAPPSQLAGAAVVLLDAHGGWSSVQRWLAASGINGSGPRVVLMTDGTSPVGELTARRAGVWGWFAHKATLGTATTVVRTVLNGRHCFPVQTGAASLPAPRHPLTTREQQVLAEIAAGVSYAEIAERLKVSHNTVRTHATSIRTKLGVRSRSAAVAAAHGVRILDAAEGA